MDHIEEPMRSKPQTLNHTTTSPQSRRNTKNLSLQLNQQKSTSEKKALSPQIQSPIPFPISSFSTVASEQQNSAGYRLYRHPSLSLPSKSDPSNLMGVVPNGGAPLKRRTTLSLFIPTDSEVSKASAKLSSNSIPSFSSSSPISSSPLVPSTPLEFTTHKTSSSCSAESSSHNTITSIPQSSEQTLKTQTLIHKFSNVRLSSDENATNVNSYPNGPVCVMEPNLYLYSEPTSEELDSFDLVMNVAKELTPPVSSIKLEKNQISRITLENAKKTNYIFVPWTHTSKLCQDLPKLIEVIQQFLAENRKVLIHCQCGVSRSASLIVALFMKLNNSTLNDSYNMLKQKAPNISPNMSLIFQLMEWGEIIGVNGDTSSSMYDFDGSLGSPGKTQDSTAPDNNLGIYNDNLIETYQS